MSSNETTAELAAFFESYRLAFERMDATAIAEHYAFPMQSTIDTGKIVLTPVSSIAELSSQLERLLAMYRVIEVGSARVLKLSIAEFSPRLAQVLVEWELRNRREESLYAFEATYTVAKINGKLRISGVAHNEITHYRECHARLQSVASGTQPQG